MAFIKETPQTQNRAKTVSKFVRLDENKPVFIQILEETAVEFYKYWFKDSAGRWVGYASPGYNECPIAQRNRSLGKDHPDYLKPQKVYTVNVWDVTKMVKCSNEECGAAYWPIDKIEECSCGTILTDIEPEPLNMVRVLERGVRLFRALNTLDEGTQPVDADGNPVGDLIPIMVDMNGKTLKLTDVVVQIIRTGKGSDTITQPIPALHLPAVNIVDYQDQLHKLPQGADLTPEEVISVLVDKVPLSDIYAARRAETESSESSETTDALLY